MSTHREPTPEEFKVAQACAENLAGALDELPTDLQFGAASLLISGMFKTHVKPERLVEAFDDFCAAVRRSLKEEKR